MWQEFFTNLKKVLRTKKWSPSRSCKRYSMNAAFLNLHKKHNIFVWAIDEQHWDKGNFASSIWGSLVKSYPLVALINFKQNFETTNFE